ncbi:hypothetical protein Gotur_011163 [Gossypium turneri]
MSPTEEGGGAVGAVSTDQTITNNNDSVSIDMDVPLNDGEVVYPLSLDEAFDGDKINLGAKPLIQRVPSTLRLNEDFSKYFKPKVISIGPFYHNDATLHKSEKLKLKLAALFVKKIGVDKDTLYNNMKTEIDGLKKCYDPKGLENYSNDNEKLAWMFFVDGCAILQAVYMLYGQSYCSTPNEFFIKNELLTFVYSDLFLLENQLPFRVLELLTNSRDGKKFMEAIIRFINGTVKDSQSHQQDRFWSSEWWPQQGERIHLLHLLRVRLLFKKEEKENPWRHCRFCARFFMYLINRSNQTRIKGHHSHTLRNVKELKKAGIRLKASETSCLTDISFSPFFFLGKLQLPQITVDDSTVNLIAYEMCPNFFNNFTVTSYMGFLDSLIDEAEDVKELRDAGILYHRFGSDKEVAKLIKKMNIDLVPSPVIYRHVKLQIHNHREKMWTKYPAQVYHTCFRTRWTFFAFVGAIAALSIGALQAYYTIHQRMQRSSRAEKMNAMGSEMVEKEYYLPLTLKISSTVEGGGAVGAVSTDQTIINNNTNNDSVSIDMRWTDVPLSKGELANLQSLDIALDGGQPNLTANPLIREVPSILHRTEDFMKYFKSKVISIGPLHHDDPTLHESKELKLKLAAHFVKNIGDDKDSLYRNMKKEIDCLRKCYDPKELEKSSNDNEMFFVDGCAILQAIYTRCGTYDDFYAVYGQLFIKKDLLTFVYSDLLLLENQIPFRVLELLTSSSDGEQFMNNHKVHRRHCYHPSRGQNIRPINLGTYTNRLNRFGLGSDEEVAKLFNQLNTDLVPGPMIYSGVKGQIHNHCKTTWIKHAAQGYHTYFRSPWTFLAFVGAITALLLGALQTYYTIHQPK